MVPGGMGVEKLEALKRAALTSLAEAEAEPASEYPMFLPPGLQLELIGML